MITSEVKFALTGVYYLTLSRFRGAREFPDDYGPHKNVIVGTTVKNYPNDRLKSFQFSSNSIVGIVIS